MTRERMVVECQGVNGVDGLDGMGKEAAPVSRQGREEDG